MELSDKVSYIRGLAEGMKFDFTSDVGKVIAQIIEALDYTATELSELTEAYQELNDYVEMIDGDLDELELELNGTDEDFDDDDFNLMDDEDDDDDDEDEEDAEDDEDIDSCDMFLGCICPECKGIFCVDEIDLEREPKYICPHCEKTVVGIPMDIESVPVAEPVEEEE